MIEEEWIERWFQKRGPVPEAGADYFASGALDSLAVVGLVAEIEKEFHVRFSNKHYGQPRFSTLAGLAALIRELRS